MKLTPFNIKNQEFGKSIKGYDKEEVRTFLETLSDDVEKLISENEELKKRLSVNDEKIDEYVRIERNLKDTLINAQESSTKTVETAKKQTTLLMKEAELKASQIVEKAKHDANEIRNSVLKLREEKTLLLARLKAIINTQTDVLEISNNKEETNRNSKIQKKDKPDSNINVDDIVEKLL